MSARGWIVTGLSLLLTSGLAGVEPTDTAPISGDGDGTPLPVMPGESPDHQAKLRDIRELLSVTGGDRIGIQVLSQMIGSFKKNIKGVPEAYWTRIMKEAHPEDFIEMIVPIYDKHLTHQDILDSIAFYKTPAGQHIAVALPVISTEAMNAGQAWGKALGQRVLAEIHAERTRNGADASETEAGPVGNQPHGDSAPASPTPAHGTP